PSPTTTRALKERFLPPFTTLVTRLIATTWSLSSRLPTSIFSVTPFISAPSVFSASSAASASSPSLELQPRFPGRVGQSFHPPVVLEAAAVEDHGADALLLGPARDQLAHGLGSRDVAAPLRLRPQLLVEGGGGAQRAAVLVVDDLGVDVALAAEHREAR